MTVVVGENGIRLYVGREEVGSTEHGFSSLLSADSPLHFGYDAGNDDYRSHGSNDFRGTKRNVYTSELAGEEAGICLLSGGDHHARAQVRSESVDLLALERSLSGTNADVWLDRQPVLDEEPTLDAGETIRGNVTFEIVNSS